MNYIPRPITKHHRARLIAWTLSMLLWTFQALCAGMFSPRHERQRHERMSLTWLTQQVKLLIISRANDLASMRIVAANASAIAAAATCSNPASSTP